MHLCSTYAVRKTLIIILIAYFTAQLRTIWQQNLFLKRENKNTCQYWQILGLVFGLFSGLKLLPISMNIFEFM